MFIHPFLSRGEVRSQSFVEENRIGWILKNLSCLSSHDPVYPTLFYSGFSVISVANVFLLDLFPEIQEDQQSTRK
jgi:hypothetical protein